MRDYAKQRPYSIKIRSDSAPSFPDHSNNSLPSKLPPGLQLPSSIPNLPRSNRRLLGHHRSWGNPCTRNVHHPSSKISPNIIVKPSRRLPTRAFTRTLDSPWMRFSSSLLCLDEEYVIENRLIPVGLLATFSPNPNNRSN